MEELTRQLFSFSPICYTPTNMKRIIELDNQEAREFLLKDESYCNFDLPPYFTFSALLSDLFSKFEERGIEDFYSTEDGKTRRPSQFENVNYKLLSNKSGQYAWRPLQLIHPALYVELVRVITEEDNWQNVKHRFEEFKLDSLVECTSLPVVSESDRSDKSDQINSWWREVELKSIQLGLDYQYLYHTDISNCYGSIYTHSIAWALHDKNVAKVQRNNTKLLGNRIDRIIRGMSHGQTNGIPQGSVLMDLIAEMVLGYADLILKDTISSKKDFKIIRYRDDYRIFANTPEVAESVIKSIGEVLSELGLGLNDSKTLKSDNIVRDSIKIDKYYFQTNQCSPTKKEPIPYLLYIFESSSKFPNSGSLVSQLDVFFQAIEEEDIASADDIYVLVSIATNIAIKNPRTYPLIVAIVSRLISCLNDDEKEKVLRKIFDRFNRIPNTGHLEIWLQRLSAKLGFDFDYSDKLCKKFVDQDSGVWCSEWLRDEIKNLFDSSSIVDQDKFNDLAPTVTNEEVELFKRLYPN